MNNEQWGLKCDIAPCFVARLVQEGYQLHYLADRAGITGEFSKEQIYQLKPVISANGRYARTSADHRGT